jgi:hypothetical protein
VGDPESFERLHGRSRARGLELHDGEPLVERILFSCISGLAVLSVIAMFVLSVFSV